MHGYGLTAAAGETTELGMSTGTGVTTGTMNWFNLPCPEGLKNSFVTWHNCKVFSL